MIRKLLIFTLLAVAAAASIVLPIWKSDAAQATHIAATNHVSQVVRTLTVASVNPTSAVPVTVSPNDNGGRGNGVTQFTRSYNNNTQVNLTASATVGISTFQKWQRNGVDWSTNPSTTVTMDADYTMTAVFIGEDGNTARVTRASTKKNSTARANK